MERTFGVIGLGRIGGGLALQALRKGMRVVGHDRAGARAELRSAGLLELATPGELRRSLARPRAVFVYVPAGPAVDAVLRDLESALEEGDVVVDGGNSYWGDSMRRAERLRGRGVGFVDLGTSGGPAGAEHGACFMAGGDPPAVARVEDVLRALSIPGGFVHCGPSGSGHFAKLVHNGIEFGMLQAIGEGLALLEASPAPVDVPAVLRAWRHGSVIRSWLLELLDDEYRARGGAAAVPAHVEDTGEVNWLVADALRMEVPVPVIAQAIMELFSSRDDRRTAWRAVAMMRHAFGGHPYGRDPGIARARTTSQVDPRPPAGADAAASPDEPP